MIAFQQMYENRDYDRMRDIMHPDFFMVLQQSTREDFPDVGDFIELNEELRMHERMFSGQSVVDPNGSIVPAISEITFSKFRQIGDWITAPQKGTLFPNADYGTWQIEILFTRPGYKDISAEGQVQFLSQSHS
jgi:hypothetical protein